MTEELTTQPIKTQRQTTQPGRTKRTGLAGRAGHILAALLSLPLPLALVPLIPVALVPPAAQAQARNWRAANEAELHSIIPARAPAISERIETEFRTASGITDGKGHFVAGVVMITAGYSAEGKYSHYFLTQVPMQIGGVALAPGDYLFGWTRVEDALKVNFYQASTGKPVGEVDAHRDLSTTRVESFRIWPPADKSVVQIGRFSFPYTLSPR